MCDITVQNFEEKYEQIIQDIRSCSFLALDCEFSGLGLNSRDISMFDEPEERYKKMRKATENVLIMQLGLSTYEYERGQNYKVSTYVFYLFPRSFPYSPERFISDSRSLQFLSVQNYDFNKTFKYGLTYISVLDEEEIMKEVKDGRMLMRLKSELSFEDRRTAEDICKTVYNWLYQPRTVGHMVVDLSGFDPVRRFLVRNHIEMQYKVRTWYVDKFKLRIEKGSRSEREKNEELYRLVLGISGLIKEIIELKKPIVGHNMFLDLMMFYKSFYRPLPNTYSKFKKEIVKIFPAMYDTKLMAFEMKRRVGRTYLDTPFNLKRLYEYFSKYQGRNMLSEMPTIELKHNWHLLASNIHDSGYDSYCTGYVYLQLAHMFSMLNMEKNVLINFPIGNNPACYFRVTEPLKNRVNMIRGKIGHFNLNGEEPSTEKQNVLHVKTLEGEDIDHYELTNIIVKYDSADLRPLEADEVLIASSCEKKLLAIENAIARTGMYKTSWYRPKHSILSEKICIALAAIAVAGIFYLFRTYKKI